MVVKKINAEVSSVNKKLQINLVFHIFLKGITKKLPVIGQDSKFINRRSVTFVFIDDFKINSIAYFFLRRIRNMFRALGGQSPTLWKISIRCCIQSSTKPEAIEATETNFKPKKITKTETDDNKHLFKYSSLSATATFQC